MILIALNDYYNRLVEQGVDDVPPFGFSQEQVSFALVINRAGDLVDVISLMDTSGKKPRPRVMQVPQPPKRSSGISPCLFWDKTGYVLGLTASEAERDIERAGRTFDAFRNYHQELLDGTEDEGLQALLAFLTKWNPVSPELIDKVPPEALDTNIVFRVDGERDFLHQRPAARAVRAKQVEQNSEGSTTCLVTGEIASISQLHPTIKNVNGAQSSGASLVSFNQNAFESYGKSQGDNAPVSSRASFGYGTALNYLLRRGEANKHRLQIGDATVVFWAEAGANTSCDTAESLFSILLQPPGHDDESENVLLQSTLSAVAKGRPLTDLNMDLQPDTRIFVLGLSPNAARLSIRFWQVDSLEVFARRMAQHYQDMLLDPLPWKSEPAIWRLLSETVPHRGGSKPKLEDVAPHLAGELARSILTGQRYPRSLLSNLLMRMRADGDISSLRVALCKAVLTREARLTKKLTNHKEIPVSLDTENSDPGYLLGRLFASLESIQSAALGRNVNATIRDRYFGAASATPAHIFPVLLRSAQNHMSKVKKNKPGLATNLEKQLDEIVGKLPSQFPKSLGMESQGRFAIGYYHQRAEIFKKHEPEIMEGEE
ncbi:MAG: type I-C CRISPR-associated protein Cas8c/Csd1 [Pseudohongiella sp.]|uniref:type I-C CRISPR-associated protein Cas8c/Csd1 n=1 Tax=Pseudohongiella sp. TaxID=1979412 RepID=UPI0034A086FD